MPTLTIRKLDLAGHETYAYPGTLVARTPQGIVLEAFFSRADRLDLGYTVFERGDRFVEYFYADRWYNIFEVYAVGTGALRGWYCNLARPAQIEDHRVNAVDLALDVWIAPDGESRILDETEFAALPLAPDEVRAVRAACAELLSLAARHAGPFVKIKAPLQAEEGLP
jgi:hypothetical protein